MGSQSVALHQRMTQHVRQMHARFVCTHFLDPDSLFVCTAVDTIYEAMAQCSALNPDEDSGTSQALLMCVCADRN